MSGKVVGWAAEQKTGSPLSKLVLIKLADNANDKGYCFPSVELLVEHTELSERSVRAHLYKLEKMGFITIIRRKDRGVHLANEYQLNLSDRGVAAAATPPREQTEKGIASGATPLQETARGDAAAARGVLQQLPDNKEEPSIEPSTNPQGAQAREGEVLSPEGMFELEWIEFQRLPNFPKDYRKTTAWKARQRVTDQLPPHGEMITAIRAYAAWLAAQNEQRRKARIQGEKIPIAPASWYAGAEWRTWLEEGHPPTPEDAVDRFDAVDVDLRARLRLCGFEDSVITAYFGFCLFEAGEPCRLTVTKVVVLDKIENEWRQKMEAHLGVGFELILLRRPAA